MNDPVNNFCGLVRNSFPGASIVYSQGACWQFHKILRAVWPQAKPFFDQEYHVFTNIDGSFYDIEGKKLSKEPMIELTKAQLAQAHRWNSSLSASLGEFLLPFEGRTQSVHINTKKTYRKRIQ